jgi:hypothetical protein
LLDIGNDGIQPDIHFIDGRLIGAADVQAEPHFAGNLRHAGMLMRVECAERAHHPPPLGVQFRPCLIQPMGQFRRRDNGIAPPGARRGTGMIPLTPHSGVAMPPVARQRGDDAQRDLLAVQQRPLLDMQFQESRYIVRAEFAPSGPHRVGVVTQIAHMVGQAAPGITTRRLQNLRRQNAQRRPRARIAGGKPGAALLGPRRHHRDVPRRHVARAAHARHRRQPRHHARGAIVIAAARHAVQMAADHHPLGCPIRPRQSHIQIAGMVIVHLQAQGRSFIPHDGMGHLFARAIGLPRHANNIGSSLAQSIKKTLGKLHIRHEIGQHDDLRTNLL